MGTRRGYEKTRLQPLHLILRRTSPAATQENAFHPMNYDGRVAVQCGDQERLSKREGKLRGKHRDSPSRRRGLFNDAPLLMAQMTSHLKHPFDPSRPCKPWDQTPARVAVLATLLHY